MEHVGGKYRSKSRISSSMKVALHERKVTPDVVVLGAQIASSVGPTVVRYRTDSGALVRIDGVAVGAFDREHERVTLDPASHSRDLTLEVERRSLPTNGLPPGPGLRWRWIVWRAGANPRRRMTVEPAPEPAATPSSTGQRVEQAVPLWGHSHLDVAWLWTYDQTRRKALRTFSTALSLLDADSGFVFMQSQPQLFDYVREDDAKLFARVVRQARAGRFDPGVAALWVEPDCNVPSGESLLRQMLYAHCFCVEHFGVEPAIAWLPDTFGFARTLPSLLAHAGIRYFGTTKLQWNDTTRFEHPQFVWRGPDGAEVIAASIDRMEGGCDPQRVAIARERGEPLIVGYGDGGGGPTREQLDAARHVGRWERPHEWFARLDARRGELPVHDDELYLEYHRGVYTTHHDVKAQNAWLERRLTAAEEQAAWCVAIGAPTEAAGRVRRALCDAWRIVLRNQFHDVLPGTSIAPVYVDARAEYARAHELVDAAVSACRTILPRAARNPRPPARVAPVQRDGDYLFESDALHARVLESGALVELTERSGGENLVAQANLLALYRDRPKRWDAWNIDAGYERSRRAAKPRDACVVDGALQIRFDLGRSRATMQIALFEGEPFLRVELAVDWHERHRLLRVENWFTASSDEVVYGAPHGIVRRRSRPDTAAR
ncbi:MAG TPA: glycoside hydrolase family 38 C-terminal domain-containing protein, partial [Candidatus Baltobacteraceae bacterium]|nr:glycoside hydrolase family 38 C-terminal domain-containing protein [Candidatus Baltobacteraceae bacterium]